MLAIIGAFLTLCLAVNGYFLRGIFEDLNAVKINIAKIMAYDEYKEKRIESLEASLRDVYSRLNQLEREVLK